MGYDWYCFNNGRYFYDDRKKDIKEEQNVKGNRWLLYAIGSAVFASFTSILGKIGISE